MSTGVWLRLDDAITYEHVLSVIERHDDLYLAVTEESAQVTVAAPQMLGSAATPLVVLARTDHVAAARAALDAGAAGIVAWPEEAPLLAERLLDAASPTGVSSGHHPVIQVVGATGGCGASTLVAHLAASIACVVADLRGGIHNQMVYAPDRSPTRLHLGDSISAGSLRRALAPHASGMPCLYAAEPWERLMPLASLRGLGAPVITDGPQPDADVSVLAVADDMGALRAASAISPASSLIVVCRLRRSRMSMRSTRRALGEDAGENLHVVPFDARIPHAAARGMLAAKGPAVRAIRSIAETLKEML